MERKLLDTYLENNVVNFSDNTETIFAIVDGNKLIQNKYQIELSNGVNVNLLILNVNKEISLDILLNQDSNLHIESVLEQDINLLKINAKLLKNASITGYLADFSSGSLNCETSIELLGEASSAKWHIASLAAKNDTKEFATSIYHIAQRTYGLTDSYGVSKDDAKLVFSGVSKINKNSKFSKTHQNAKIMVFDEFSKAIAKPILKIDENEIEASHGASVGKVSDETLFYLTSRGLTKEVAKELITLGYLKPIMKGFVDEEIRGIIASLIERRM